MNKLNKILDEIQIALPIHKVASDFEEYIFSKDEATIELGELKIRLTRGTELI